MLDDEMRDTKYRHCPHYRFDGIGREIDEILFEILRVSIKMSHKRCIYILQTPSRHHCIIACDEKSSEYTQASHQSPYPRSRNLVVGPCSVSLCMTTDNKLAHHTWQSKDYHTQDIKDNKGGSTVFTGHIWKSPYITETNGRTGSSEYYTHLTAEFCSFFL